jgi:hypothetical protein
MSQVVKHPFPIVSQETLAIAGRLKSTNVGDVVSWSEMVSLTGIPRERIGARVRSACSMLMREYKLHFRTCRGVGVERIDHGAVARDSAPRQRKRMRSAAKRLVRMTQNVVLDGLKPDERMSIICHQTIGELTLAASSEKSAKQLQSGDRTVSPLSPKEAMARLLSG